LPIVITRYVLFVLLFRRNKSRSGAMDASSGKIFPFMEIRRREWKIPSTQNKTLTNFTADHSEK